MNTELTDTHDHATTDITVDGNAQVSARPDTILLRMELKGTAPAYDQALQAVDSRTRQLMEAMTECGIHETLVTERFDIEEVWRDRYDDSSTSCSPRPASTTGRSCSRSTSCSSAMATSACSCFRAGPMMASSRLTVSPERSDNPTLSFQGTIGVALMQAHVPGRSQRQSTRSTEDVAAGP